MELEESFLNMSPVYNGKKHIDLEKRESYREI
jgi:hypothetical protein